MFKHELKFIRDTHGNMVATYNSVYVYEHVYVCGKNLQKTKTVDKEEFLKRKNGPFGHNKRR